MSEQIDSGWMDIDPSTIETRFTVVIRGQEVPVYLSPYDIPSAIRFTIDPATASLRIRFRYLAEEETRAKVIDGIEVRVGKVSDRIHEFSIKLGPTEKKRKTQHSFSHQDRVKSAFSHLNRSASSSIRHKNDVLENVVVRQSRTLPFEVL